METVGAGVPTHMYYVNLYTKVLFVYKLNTKLLLNMLEKNVLMKYGKIFLV